MKSNILTIVACLCFVSVNAQQKTEKKINFSGKETLTLDIQIADSINISTWNGNELLINSSVNVNDNKDNDRYIISYNESGKSVVVHAGFDKNYFKGRNNCCDKADIYWNVYLPENTSLNVETINGNITITGKTGNLKAKSISGFIDLSEPENKNADIDFSTISGMIYTNHALSISSNHSGIPVRITDKLNAGGTPVKLETISGDIFFRKAD